jgi:hypothetical protein
MSRPVLALEHLVIRPGYAEALSLLVGKFKKSGATLPALVSELRPPPGRPRRLLSAQLHHKLQGLAHEKLVEYVPFAAEFQRNERLGGMRSKGRAPSGKWIITTRGADYWASRLSIELANGFSEAIRSTPDERKHVTNIGMPTVLLVNCGPIRKDSIGLRRLIEGPTLGIRKAAQEIALEIWAQSSRVAADWKALQTLRQKFPRDESRVFTTPEWLALKEWPVPVRRAHRKVEKHRVLICLELNPAYWDNLPIDRLDQKREEYADLQRQRKHALARRRRDDPSMRPAP